MSSKWRPVLYTVAGVGAGLLVVIAMWVLVTVLGIAGAIRETQVNNTGTLESADAAAEAAEAGTERIIDCTTPGQACYEQGQRRTGQAVADINRVVVYAAACADRPEQQSEAEISACVIQRLAQDDRSE